MNDQEVELKRKAFKVLANAINHKPKVGDTEGVVVLSSGSLQIWWTDEQDQTHEWVCDVYASQLGVPFQVAR